MTFRLTRFTEATAFAARTEPFLVAREAANNLILGLTAGLLADPEASPPPYLATVEAGESVVAAALMLPPHQLVLSASEHPEAIDWLAPDVQAFRPDTPGVQGPVPLSQRFAEHWQAQTGQAYRRRMALRAYQLTHVRPPRGVPGGMRRARPEDRALAVRWLRAFMQEAQGEADPPGVERVADRWLQGRERSLYLWEDGEPVACAGCSGPTPNGIRIGAVYTPPERRRRGYASALTAALSQAMLDAGRRYCFLYTDLANPTSNRIYQAIGYEPVCDVDEFVFIPDR